MAAAQSTRRVYSAEELHRLRSDASQARLRDLLEDKDEEDAALVKEHVLRSSKSFAARSWKSRASANSLRIPSEPSKKENRSTNASDNDRQSSGTQRPMEAPPTSMLNGLQPNSHMFRPGPDSWRFRGSPTASLKRKKAEAIVKAHGSPTHVRVTAGGRIVPSDQSPLCHPRYGYSAVKANGGLVKFAPNYSQGKSTQWTQATQNGFVAQDVNGRLCQIVNGAILPLKEVDGALQLFMPAPNLNITQRNSSLGGITGHVANALSGNQPHQASRVVPSEPSPASQINALEMEYAKLEHDLKDIDKTEALHGRTMHKAAREALIARRVELVTAMDRIRKSLKNIRQETQCGVPAAAPGSFPPSEKQLSVSPPPPHSRLPAFLQHRQPQYSSNAVLPPAPAPPTAVYGPFFDVPGQPQYPGAFSYQPTPSPDSGFAGQPWMMSAPPLFVPPPPFDGSLSSTSLPYQEGFTMPIQQMAMPPPMAATQPELGNVANDRAEVRLPQNDGAYSCADVPKVSPRSHALAIKVPTSAAKSNLNPMSPAYKPAPGNPKEQHPVAKPFQHGGVLPRSRQAQPVSQTQLYIVNATDNTISPTKKSVHLHSSSISSFETADFFPRNTREYSTKQYAYPPSADSEDKENLDPQRHDSKVDAPVTPGTVETLEARHTSDVRNNSSKITRTQTGGYKAPTVPPGTPVDPPSSMSNAPLPIKIDGMMWDRQSHGYNASAVPDRHAHNVSPIKRRDWHFVEDHPEHPATSSSAKFHACQEEICVTSSPYDMEDLSDKSRDWLEGFQAGLSRNAVGTDHAGDFLQGYCAGLLKSQPAGNVASTGSPIKSASRRPSPVPPQSQASASLHPERCRPIASRPPILPLERSVQSLDTLKQAIFAPQNENAILTPTLDGPSVNDNPFDLGGWAKSHEGSTAASDTALIAQSQEIPGFSFSSRDSSMMRHLTQSSSHERLGPRNERLGMQHADQVDHSFVRGLHSGHVQSTVASPCLSAKSTPPVSFASSGPIQQRISSITSLDSASHPYCRAPPAHRVLSGGPHVVEPWKSATSVGLTTGFFAQAQFDGTHDTFGSSRWRDAVLTGADAIVTGPSTAQQRHHHLAGFVQQQQMQHQQRPRSVLSGMSSGAESAAFASTAGVNALGKQSKFKEGSLDGMSNAPGSPSGTSPSKSALRAREHQQRAKESPSKSASPARAKFEHIAAKVGITVAAKEKERERDGVHGRSAGSDLDAPASPTGKNRWRNVWRGGSKKEATKDEMA